jgi:aryl-alcohol dehydrogenase-like predicted oxidoreductase
VRYLQLDSAKRISKIGLGTSQFGSWQWDYGEEYARVETRKIVRRAVELGVTLFDTAEIYAAGRSERILGAALEDDRRSVVVATKVYPVLPLASLIKERAVASSIRLGLPTIDLYQVHWANPLVNDRVIMRAMRGLRRAHLIRDVGVSRYSTSRWQAAEAALGSRIISNQVEYSLMNRTAEVELLPFAESRQRAILAFSPLAQGLLAGKYDLVGSRPGGVRAKSALFGEESMERAGEILAVVREIAAEHSASVAQVALAWVIRRPLVAAIAGAATVEQLESNVAAADIQLAPDECKALDTAASRSRPLSAPAEPRTFSMQTLKDCAKARNLVKTAWRDYRLECRESDGTSIDWEA